VVPGADDEPGPERVLSDEAVAYAEAVVHGVQSHQADIDALIARYADRWAIQRMPVVDRTLLRIALYELLWRDDIPVAVAINEAVELAKELSTDDSGRFINGLLGRVVEDRGHA
jgi:N utilization substance protein B